MVVGLIPFAVAFAVYLFVFLEIRPGATGDEPHYLITAESIAYDLDVDLRNDYASAERVLRMVNVFPLGPDAFVYKESGELRPFRGVGLPAVLAPGVALGGLTGARLVMILIAALLADQLYRLLRDLRLRRRYRVLAWGAALFCLPVVVFSSQIYPELAGALLVVAALRVMVVGASRPAALALGSAAAAALVWLHVRYFPLSVGLLFGLALAACVHDWSPGRKAWTQGDRRSRARDSSFDVPSSSSSAGARSRCRSSCPTPSASDCSSPPSSDWYGSPDLHASYEAYGSPAVGTRTTGTSGTSSLCRDILDPVVGWIPFAPVHWLGFAALGCLVVVFGWPAAGCIAVAAGYELVISSVGTGVGFGLPARYPMIVVPLIAVPLAVAIQRIRVARVVFVPLLAVSIVFAVAAVRNFGLLYPGDSSADLRNAEHCSGFPGAGRGSGPSVFHSRARRAAGARRRESSKEARSSQGRVETSPGSSGSDRTSGSKTAAPIWRRSLLRPTGSAPMSWSPSSRSLSGEAILASKALTGRQLQPSRTQQHRPAIREPGRLCRDTRLLPRSRHAASRPDQRPADRPRRSPQPTSATGLWHSCG